MGKGLTSENSYQNLSSWEGFSLSDSNLVFLREVKLLSGGSSKFSRARFYVKSFFPFKFPIIFYHFSYKILYFCYNK